MPINQNLARSYEYHGVSLLRGPPHMWLKSTACTQGFLLFLIARNLITKNQIY